jgi:hypothetical protein
VSAHLFRSRPVAELRDARLMAHRLILAKPDAPGALLHALYCLELGAEIRRRGELAFDCPYCQADVDAAAGVKSEPYPAVKPEWTRGLHDALAPRELVEASR